MEGELAQRIVQRLAMGALGFSDLLREFADAEYRDILLAWGEIRDRVPLARDEQGRYLLPAKGEPPAPGR